MDGACKQTDKRGRMEALARRLRAGTITDADYERQIDDLLGTALSERDPQVERAWEARRRPAP